MGAFDNFNFDPNDPVIQAGLSIMANSGPSLTPVNPFSGLQKTMQNVSQQQRLAKNDAFSQKMDLENLTLRKNATAENLRRFNLGQQEKAQQRQDTLKRQNKTINWFKQNGWNDLADYATSTGDMNGAYKIAQERVKSGFSEPQEQQYPSGLTTDKAREAYDKQTGKGVADQQLSDQANIEGAVSFLGKIDRMTEQLKQMTDDEFGPLQSQPAYNMIIPGRSDNMARQQQFKANLSDLELDVAKMKLKGQGQVTESERAIARETIGGLGSADKATQQKILDERKLEAIGHIEKGLRNGTVTPSQLQAQGIDISKLVAEKERIITQRMTTPKDQADRTKAPESVPQDIWDFMEPEERQLWLR